MIKTPQMKNCCTGVIILWRERELEERSLKRPPGKTFPLNDSPNISLPLDIPFLPSPPPPWINNIHLTYFSPEVLMSTLSKYDVPVLHKMAATFVAGCVTKMSVPSQYSCRSNVQHLYICRLKFSENKYKFIVLTVF